MRYLEWRRFSNFLAFYISVNTVPRIYGDTFNSNFSCREVKITLASKYCFCAIRPYPFNMLLLVPDWPCHFQIVKSGCVHTVWIQDVHYSYIAALLRIRASKIGTDLLGFLKFSRPPKWFFFHYACTYLDRTLESVDWFWSANARNCAGQNSFNWER